MCCRKITQMNDVYLACAHILDVQTVYCMLCKLGCVASETTLLGYVYSAASDARTQCGRSDTHPA